MRKVKVFILALTSLMVFAGTLQASAPDNTPKKNLRSELIRLIDRPAEGILQESNAEVNLQLMVNGNREVIVINTGTDDPLLDAYLKSKLNYRKVEADDIQYFTFYYLKVRFES